MVGTKIQNVRIKNEGLSVIAIPSVRMIYRHMYLPELSSKTSSRKYKTVWNGWNVFNEKEIDCKMEWRPITSFLNIPSFLVVREALANRSGEWGNHGMNYDFWWWLMMSHDFCASLGKDGILCLFSDSSLTFKQTNRAQQNKGCSAKWNFDIFINCYDISL